MYFLYVLCRERGMWKRKIRHVLKKLLGSPLFLDLESHFGLLGNTALCWNFLVIATERQC